MLVSITSFIWNASSGSFCMTLTNSSYVTDHSLLLLMSSDYKTCHFCDAPRHNAALIYPSHFFFVTKHSHRRALSSPLTSQQQLNDAQVTPLLHLTTQHLESAQKTQTSHIAPAYERRIFIQSFLQLITSFYLGDQLATFWLKGFPFKENSR